MNSPERNPGKTLIWLAGFMGTGKTSTGRELAERLSVPFFDTDALIVERAGMSAPEIFQRHGEPHFRNLESQAIEGLAASEGRSVVALGGGAPLDENNRRAMSRSGRVILLTAGVQTIIARIGSVPGRPLFPGRDAPHAIAELLESRAEAYRKAADLIVETDEKSPGQVADEILQTMARAGISLL